MAISARENILSLSRLLFAGGSLRRRKGDLFNLYHPHGDGRRSEEIFSLLSVAMEGEEIFSLRRHMCSLSVAGKWQQQQIHRLNIHEYQGAELMGKYGVNVPKGVVVSTLDEVKKTIQDVFPNESELVVKNQILAGGRGLGTFSLKILLVLCMVSCLWPSSSVVFVVSGFIDLVLIFIIVGKMLGQVLLTKQTGPQGKVVSKFCSAVNFSVY
ncbi:unnamed protein product [Arabis nemorensis]|uniref:ATP-grasp fold succinyl-CoA synthetase-type domain-containing protein n=1 Tax=Arabis nemorensis TaxID=586526 RepID=A0A565C250_9BRAS|nr:unnamed protein product [Arabis nemorensis]